MSKCNLKNLKYDSVKSLLKLHRENKASKLNVIWIEAAGCSGNVISFLDSVDPDASYVLKNIINLIYNNSIMGYQGTQAFEKILEGSNEPFILLVDGAISVKNNGSSNIVATYEGKSISALELIKRLAEKATHIIAVGTCASFGGISAAFPNPSECKPVSQVIDKKIINLPGCPCNPKWLIGTLSYISLYGIPPLDDKNRPTLFYSKTVHDSCPRRAYFEKGVFAKALGDEECMLKLGCKGPLTYANCPYNQWNNKTNWPIDDNTPCIGCANENFPYRTFFD